MRRLAVLAAPVVVLAGAVSCSRPTPGNPGTTTTSAAPSTTSPPTTGPPTTGAPGGGGLGPPAPVVGGLEVPWALAFVDADTVLVTERPGRVRVVDGGQLRPDPVGTFAVTSTGESGLMGIALHPAFPQERYAYVSYSADGGNRLVRVPVGEDLTFGPEQVLLDRIPFAQFHDGGGVAFGPDGMLYALTGDARQPDLAADRASLAGKVLRLRPDGSVPDDNPFPGSPVWSWGHRNPQGLGWDAAGNLYVSEHGPSGDLGQCCHDEINLIRKGAFYGWPFFAGNTSIAPNPPVEPVAPVAESGGGETWAPSGLAVRPMADGGTELYVAQLRATRLDRFTVAAGQPGTLGEPTTVVSGEGRLRVAQMAPDGCLWFSTSNRDGRGQVQPGDDQLLRSCPG